MCITHVRVQVPPRAPKKGTGYPIGCPVSFCIFDFALKRGHMTGIYRLYFRAPHHPWETAYLRIVRHSRALHPLVPHIHNRAYALRQRTACGRLHYRCFQFIKDRIKGKSCFRAAKNLEAIESFKVLRWWTVQDSNLWPPARQAGALASWANRPKRNPWNYWVFNCFSLQQTPAFLPVRAPALFV